jgi:hypothetical protein
MASRTTEALRQLGRVEAATAALGNAIAEVDNDEALDRDATSDELRRHFGALELELTLLRQMTVKGGNVS